MPSSRDAGAIAAIATGWRRVLRAPALTLGIWAASVAIALPFAVVVKGAIQQHLGASVDAERVAAGWDQPWAAEFAAQAQGLSRTFTYEILGFGGTLGILSAALDNDGIPKKASAGRQDLVVQRFIACGHALHIELGLDTAPAGLTHL